MLLQQPCRQFGHGDGGLGLDRLDQEGLISHQLAASGRTALAGRRGRAGVPRSPHELDGETVADAEVAGRRPAGVAGFYKARNPHAKIEGIAVPHDPPPVQESESQLRPAQKPRSLISSPML